MARHRRYVQSVAGVMGVVLVTYGALRVYTFPGSASLANQVVRSLIADALDSNRQRAALDPSDYASIVPADTGPTFASRYITAAWQIPPTYSTPARGWAARSAQTDSPALRAWLDDRIFATTRTRADTIHLTWRGFGRVDGCPWIRTLRAALIREDDLGLHVARVTANCPGSSR